ncbi:MAG: hypothetical protein HN742_05335 [Lentisphaerae bacterium]|jgi:D-amino peptidase|nr:hypothetical protein [Lentisphaerota bacterium]MBT4819483.1 hypothetical protein [Lentisphaerota bacterium]MBT5610758.1 hypothetical protein [Lentisphaerota bacterium]MBT7060840.1 hypothetical protein [Lentisphaerota bacterium]MBT7841271.1 hypothetical protein [Lentisphaerota bacterium]
MRLYIMTDLEGVAGVRDFAEWTGPDKRYYDLARELLTEELNAAIDGFFAGGVDSILVADGHGPGALDITRLDPRVEMLRGWGSGWPLGLEDGSFDAIAWVGQHAKSRTPFSNMAHTQGCRYLELSINGTAIGEFGQLAMCATELGIRAIFAAGEEAFAAEAEALVPGVTTVVGKRGTKPGRGDECSEAQYRARNGGAIHRHPLVVREALRAGAKSAAERASDGPSGYVDLTPPYHCTVVYRETDCAPRQFGTRMHPDSISKLMNMPVNLQPVRDDAHLAELLVD